MFLEELDRAVGLIGQNPHRFPAHEFGTRRIVLWLFPFVLVFRDMPAGVEIIAVAHGRRRPGYWRDRMA
jgi:hypothetical protein